jgi:hypothetical protein
MKNVMVKFEKEAFLYQHDIRVLIIFRRRKYSRQKIIHLQLSPSQSGSNSTPKLYKNQHENLLNKVISNQPKSLFFLWNIDETF